MLIDCDSCTLRGAAAACSGCLVSALLDQPPAQAALTADEMHAIEVFTRAGFDVEILDAPVSAPLRLATRRRRRRVA
ncbi:hypothetical protein [Plantactinospora endophytica]|uniref:Uncharacterized protein n=1 Tax=Plantactinospora endophytica TaxID=673535 RepID=A0ABQ4E738_9ACTN|nr:hypothetical protein [Plantactinospora endophytica]GIG90136.1 hypothetical protein Pen02_50720 [Plantactinospora endophytica]